MDISWAALFYTGPKTQLANGRWVTGTVQNPSSQFLIERSVPNIKVFDDRELVEPDELASFLISDDATLRGSILTSTPEESPHFSDLIATRDKDSLLRYMFTMDYKKAYSNYSLYQAMFDHLEIAPRLQERILSMCTLSTLKTF